MATLLPTGHTAYEVTPEERECLRRDFIAFDEFYQEKAYLMRLQPEEYLLPSSFIEYSLKFYNLKTTCDDVLVMGHKKTGLHLSSEIAWTMKNNKNLDNPEAWLCSNETRAAFLDLDIFLPRKTLGEHLFWKEFQKLRPDFENGDMFQLYDSKPSPRVFKTHIPISLYNENLLNNCKVLYTARHPKAVVISFFHHCTDLGLTKYIGTLDEFIDYFIQGQIVYSPYWSHLKSAWAHKDHPNMHIVIYEDLMNNKREEYAKIAKFLQVELNPAELDKIIEYTSFSAMKERANNNVVHKNGYFIGKQNKFYRKGKVDSYREVLTPEQETRLDEWIKKNSSETGIYFK